MADLHRIIADALLEADGYDPEAERAGRNGSGVVEVAEARADRVIEALGGAIDDHLETVPEIRDATLRALDVISQRVAGT